MTSVAFVSPAIVQVSRSLPATDAGWYTFVGAIPKNAQQGSGQILGSAEIEYHAGFSVLAGSSNALATLNIVSSPGAYVRILYQSNSGSVVVNGNAYQPIWYGIVNRQVTMPDGSSTIPGGLQQLQCTGIACILDNIYIRQGFSYGYLSGSGSAAPWDPGYCPLFNAKPTKNQNVFGDRYPSTELNADGSGSAYPFDLTNAGPAQPWTAAQVVNHLLTFYARPTVPPAFTTAYGPTWTLSDPLNFLNYQVDKLDLQGRTVLEGINYIINQRRGCTWRADVSGQTVTLTVYSTSSVSVTNGGVTLPASTSLVSLNSVENPFIQNLTITEDVSAKYQYIQVDGNHPLVACTLNYRQDGTGALRKGWAAAQEATWDPTKNQGPAYENVYSRFVLSDSWNGLNWGQTTIGLRNSRTYNTNGYSGARTFDSTVPAAPARMLKLEKFIPLPADISYSSTPSAGSLDMSSPLLAPMLFIKTGSVYQDITDDYSISVEEDPAAVVISGNLNDLSAIITDGTSELLVTIGIREANPLMVGVILPTTLWDNDVPKCMVRRLPNCEQWVALQGTVMGVNTTGTGFYALSSTIVPVDDTDKLNAWLSVMAFNYGVAQINVTWSDSSQIDFSATTAPGALLTTVNRGDATLTANAVITARAWTFSENGFGTTYTTERISPDVSSTEGHPRVNKVWKSQAEREDMQ